MERSSERFSDEVAKISQRLARDGIGALGALFDLTAVRLVRYAITVTGNQHDAEDAVQAALTKMGLRPKTLAEAVSPWGYLLGTLRNECLRIRRESKRVKNDPSLIDLCTHPLIDAVEQEDSQRAIWQAIRSIPLEQAEIVVLKIWEGLTFEAIAELLQMSPNTVASRYQYGLKKLATALGEHQREGVI